jgi:hypothetical protein
VVGQKAGWGRRSVHSVAPVPWLVPVFGALSPDASASGVRFVWSPSHLSSVVPSGLHANNAVWEAGCIRALQIDSFPHSISQSSNKSKPKQSTRPSVLAQA